MELETGNSKSFNNSAIADLLGDAGRYTLRSERGLSVEAAAAGENIDALIWE